MIPDTVITRLRRAKKYAILTGAGVSKESGVPTFRDAAESIWNNFDPAKVASVEGFRANPDGVWAWYATRAAAVRNAEPNAAHRAITQLADVVPTIVITQNVDSLHQKSGSSGVLELYGSLMRLKTLVDEDELFSGGCQPSICHCCNGFCNPDSLNHYANRQDFLSIELKGTKALKCPGCGNWLRPDLTWFGEMLDADVLSGAISATDNCDAMIVVGCGLNVQPAASLPFRALAHGATVVEVNPERTCLSDRADTYMKGTAATVLPMLVKKIWGMHVSD